MKLEGFTKICISQKTFLRIFALKREMHIKKPMKIISEGLTLAINPEVTQETKISFTAGISF